MLIEFKKPVTLEMLKLITEALQVKPTYNQISCGCGEGWSDERCDLLTVDGKCYCIFNFIDIKEL